MSAFPTFDEMWTQKTDEQLFGALIHKDDYVPEAIDSIRREIARRNLDTQRIAEIEAQVGKAREHKDVIAQMPLQWPLRILMFLLSFGIPQIIVGEYYRNKGYERRHREIWKWMVYGLLFWLAIFVLRLVMSLG